MKKYVLTALGMLAVVYILFCTSLLNIHRYPAAHNIFITTHWKQMGGFEAAAPDHMRLGCWSTALAQLARYQQLRPYGRVQYKSTRGYVINEYLDSNNYNISLLTKNIDSLTPAAERQALAAYNYAAALVMEKDFGTGSYMHLLASAAQLEAHYRIKANRYICWHGIAPYTRGKLFSVVEEEIINGRPLLFHFADLAGFGHAVVIDGYKTSNGKQWVHLNQGQGGSQDGWYDFNSDILVPGDLKLRVIYAIKPL